MSWKQQLTNDAEYQSIGKVAVESQLRDVSANSQGSHGLLQIGQYPVANGHVDDHEWHASESSFAVRVLFALFEENDRLKSET